MIRQTFEQFVDIYTLDEAGSYLGLVEQLLDIDPDEVIEARDALAHEMAEKPDVYLPRQFEDLAILYRNRCDRQLWDWSRRLEEVVMFVSRTPDCSHIEEQYARIDTFSAAHKQWQVSTYTVKILRNQGPDDIVMYDGQSVQVLRYDEHRDEWNLLKKEDQKQTLVDFFYESLRATAMQLARSPAEREMADADAKEKLEAMLYGGPKHTTSSD